MRRHLATSAVAATVLSLGGLTGFAGSAAASPPDEPIDIGAILDILTPDQIVCVMQQAGSDITDLDGAMAVLEECGISFDQIMDLAPGSTRGTTPATGQTTVEESTPGTTPSATGEPDDDTTAAVLEHFGLGDDELTCIADGLAASTPGDDNAALLVLQDCGLSLSTILHAMVSRPATSGSVASPVTSTLAEATPSVTTGDMMTDLMISTFESMGITITAEQATCLGEAAMGGIDTSDMTAMMDLLSECGIEITDLLGGG